MKTVQLLDLPRAQRLRAYTLAGEKIARRTQTFTCHALDGSIVPKRPRNLDVQKQFWGQLFGAGDNDQLLEVVETRHERWPEYERLRVSWSIFSRSKGNALRERIFTEAHETRLMMLALAHAIDEAGDLEDTLS